MKLAKSIIKWSMIVVPTILLLGVGLATVNRLSNTDAFALGETMAWLSLLWIISCLIALRIIKLFEKNRTKRQAGEKTS